MFADRCGVIIVSFYYFNTIHFVLDESGPWKIVRLIPDSNLHDYFRVQSRVAIRYLYFITKNPNLGKFWSVLKWKMLVNFKAIWSVLLLLGIFYGHLVYFVVILLFFPVLVCCTQKIWQPWSKADLRESAISKTNTWDERKKEKRKREWLCAVSLNRIYRYRQTDR
jgi:hypothetical protein